VKNTTIISLNILPPIVKECFGCYLNFVIKM
jgi:hypothetical protein